MPRLSSRVAVRDLCIPSVHSPPTQTPSSHFNKTRSVTLLSISRLGKTFSSLPSSFRVFVQGTQSWFCEKPIPASLLPSLNLLPPQARVQLECVSLICLYLHLQKTQLLSFWKLLSWNQSPLKVVGGRTGRLRKTLEFSEGRGQTFGSDPKGDSENLNFASEQTSQQMT